MQQAASGQRGSCTCPTAASCSRGLTPLLACQRLCITPCPTPWRPTHLFAGVAKIEGQLPADHLIQHHPRAPHVCLLGVAAAQHLRRHVAHGAGQLCQHLYTHTRAEAEDNAVTPISPVPISPVATASMLGFVRADASSVLHTEASATPPTFCLCVKGACWHSECTWLTCKQLGAHWTDHKGKDAARQPPTCPGVKGTLMPKSVTLMRSAVSCWGLSRGLETSRLSGLMSRCITPLGQQHGTVQAGRCAAGSISEVSCRNAPAQKPRLPACGTQHVSTQQELCVILPRTLSRTAPAGNTCHSSCHSP
jgi:hypothetical protein